MNRKRTLYELVFKRPLDILVSVVTLIVISPLFILIAILVRIKLGSPIFFKQKRPGKDEIIFNLYKFRTMTNKMDNDGNLLPDQMRITKFGKFLRSSSIDELPSLLNIFKGDLSIVGPRPLLVEYLSLYNSQQKMRHLVRPGLTGLAQINGRNKISWDKKFEYDLKYIERISLFGDLKIILKTIFKVLARKDINADSNSTVDPFRGNEK